MAWAAAKFVATNSSAFVISMMTKMRSATDAVRKPPAKRTPMTPYTRTATTTTPATGAKYGSLSIAGMMTTMATATNMNAAENSFVIT